MRLRMLGYWTVFTNLSQCTCRVQAVGEENGGRESVLLTGNVHLLRHSNSLLGDGREIQTGGCVVSCRCFFFAGFRSKEPEEISLERKSERERKRCLFLEREREKRKRMMRFRGGQKERGREREKDAAAGWMIVSEREYVYMCLSPLVVSPGCRFYRLTEQKEREHRDSETHIHT